MSKNAYEVLGVDANADQKTIDEAYNTLRLKYRNDMYQEGALGKAAAQKLSEVEQAYREICAERAASARAQTDDNDNTMGDKGGTTKHAEIFRDVEAALHVNDFRAAQAALDQVGVRNAEWHYFQAVIYYKKGWLSESKNQMEMACNMEPDNKHYQSVLSRLNDTINHANNTDNKGYNPQTQAPRNDGYQRTYTEQDARAGEDACCRWCQAMICINCLCDCCCRG